MKNLIIFIAVFFAFLLTACTQSDVAAPDYVLRYGTSFGECLGDCYQETSLTEFEAVLRVRENVIGKQTDLKVRAKENLTIQEFESINNLVDTKVIQALPETIGCPDCADGGAEWIEIQSPEIYKKVTFEYLNEPGVLTDLLTVLRAKQKKLYESAK